MPLLSLSLKQLWSAAILFFFIFCGHLFRAFGAHACATLEWILTYCWHAHKQICAAACPHEKPLQQAVRQSCQTHVPANRRRRRRRRRQFDGNKKMKKDRMGRGKESAARWRWRWEEQNKADWQQSSRWVYEPWKWWNKRSALSAKCLCANMYEQMILWWLSLGAN